MARVASGFIKSWHTYFMFLVCSSRRRSREGLLRHQREMHYTPPSDDLIGTLHPSLSSQQNIKFSEDSRRIQRGLVNIALYIDTVEYPMVSKPEGMASPTGGHGLVLRRLFTPPRSASWSHAATYTRSFHRFPLPHIASMFSRIPLHARVFRSPRSCVRTSRFSESLFCFTSTVTSAVT